MPELLESPELPDIEGRALGPLATNGYVFRAPRGWVAVDAPEGMLEWVREIGVAPDLLLLTHQHFDHVLGAGALWRRFGCPVWSFAERSPALTLEEMFDGLDGTSFEIGDYPVDRRVGEQGAAQPLDVLGAEMRVIHVPGHSPDSVCFFHPASGVLFGGDVLFAGGIGRTDFPGGDAALLAGGIREKIFPLGDDTRVYPGHGVATTVGDERRSNPFVGEGAPPA